MLKSTWYKTKGRPSEVERLHARDHGDEADQLIEIYKYTCAWLQGTWKCRLKFDWQPCLAACETDKCFPNVAENKLDNIILINLHFFKLGTRIFHYVWHCLIALGIWYKNDVAGLILSISSQCNQSFRTYITSTQRKNAHFKPNSVGKFSRVSNTDTLISKFLT